MKRSLIVALILANYTLIAQEQLDSSRVLEPVQVRAVRAADRAPFTKTNITRDHIRKLNLGQDLPFILVNQPGVVVTSDAGNGIGYTGLRIRGSDATRINVTLNGIPYNDAESQGSFFVDMPDVVSSVSSIQVQRGAGTSSNGAGSFGASIHISTNEENVKPYAELSNSIGSFNSRKHTIKAGTGLIDNHFSADVRFSKIKSDGYIERAFSDLSSYFLSFGWQNKKSSIRYNHVSGKEKTYQAWYGVHESELKERRRINHAGTETMGIPYANETDNYLQKHHQLFFKHSFNNALTFSTGLFYTPGEGYYEQYKSAQDYAYYRLPYPLIGSDTIFATNLVRQLWLDNKFYGNIFSFLFHKNAHQVTLGGALTQYDGNHFGKVIWAEQGLTSIKNWYDHDAFKKDFNIYFKHLAPLNQRINAFYDLQYRKVNYVINGFRDRPDIHTENTYNFFNPKIGFSYFHNGNSAYISFSRAAKEPNRDDFETAVHQLPRPEKLNDFEAGYSQKRSKYGFDIAAYYMRYIDQLVLTGKINDVGAYTRTNIPKSYRTGIEIQGLYSVNKWLSFSGNTAFSKNKIQDFTEFLDDYDAGVQKIIKYGSADISFSPSVVSTASLNFTFDNFELQLPARYVSRQYLDNTSNKNNSLDPYLVQDVRMNYAYNKIQHVKLNAFLHVNNVFNAQYESNGYSYSFIHTGQKVSENYYFPMAGINFMLGVTIRVE